MPSAGHDPSAWYDSPSTTAVRQAQSAPGSVKESSKGVTVAGVC
ncbi:hypothetical protein HMPREF9946_00720 [Acetobacteraceae bacterium AT-5844]|nr:hypothetical protein HMPREF9946_00720 [Acetobacteraceae bacterium AT-5844]